MHDTTNYIHSKNVTQNRFSCNITAKFTDGVSNSLMQLTSKKLSIIFNFLASSQRRLSTVIWRDYQNTPLFWH